ncbi:fluoride efflux transporter CrcB [Marinifilum flexuosum]|uniref:Fluoride-specific ion channel FluC n=1 Tax=Marinifilum flexuosum TaxID=1117708 RepID=A0A419X7R1_9BACT|nr:fluoride efflux transporter CrcB [Marinifilum flexuosum]RKE03742.1 camphor resistance protein CrcB [Marinifilum flexuosum]
MLRTLLLIGMGGFLGSVSRFLIGQGLHRIFDTVFPIGTMTVNIVGSFIIGVVYSLAERDNLISPEIRMFLAVGFCGGFTTFSSFAFDKLNLLKDSGFLYLSMYVGGSVFLGLLAVYLGTQIHKLF